MTPLGLGGAYRRHLPRGRHAGMQTWRRRGHGAAAYALAAFALLALASGTPAALVLAPLLLPMPWVSRPLRGGLLQRGPRRALRRVALEPDAPRRGEAVTVGVRGAVEIGLVATAWTDVNAYRATIARPVRLHEAWAPPGTPLSVPRDAPFSYEGRYVSTAWAVVARLPSGRVATRPVWVGA